MTAEANQHQGPPPKRRMKNYLLDARFQLKYTLMVVVVTVAVASVLGWFAYHYSQGLTEMMMIREMQVAGLDTEVAARIEADAQAEDAKVLRFIVIGIGVLVLSLAVTGIIITHKVVGPVYKLRLLFRQIEGGHLKLAGRLRKGDELQELFESFAEMVTSLRERQAREVAELDLAIERAKEEGAAPATLTRLTDIRARMQAVLD